METNSSFEVRMQFLAEEMMSTAKKITKLCQEKNVGKKKGETWKTYADREQGWKAKVVHVDE